MSDERVRELEANDRRAASRAFAAAANVAAWAMQRVPHEPFFMRDGCNVCGLPPARHPAPPENPRAS